MELPAAQSGHASYHARPRGCVSFQWGRATSLPVLQVFPRGREAFGLAAEQGWGKASAVARRATAGRLLAPRLRCCLCSWFIPPFLLFLRRVLCCLR